MKTTTILAPREAHNTHANDTVKARFCPQKIVFIGGMTAS
jgi:hypothetical protein